MKKKVKLITTIASLGLALALMAFGVYAAATATFNVTGSVSFEAKPNVDATISVYESANNLAAALEENAEGWTQTGTNYVISYTNNQNPAGGGSQALANDELTEAAGTAQYYCVKVTFHNDSTNAKNVLTVTWTAKTDDGATSNVVATQSVDSLTLNHDETKSVVFTYKVKDVANEVNNFDTSVAFSITATLA